MKTQSILKFLSLIWVSTLIYSCDPGIDLSSVDTTVEIDQALVIPIGEVNVTTKNLLEQIGTLSKNITNGESVGDPVTNGIFLITELNKQYDIPPLDLLKKYSPFSLRYNLPYNPLVTTFGANNNFPDILDSLDLGYNHSNDLERVDEIEIESASFSVMVGVEGFNVQPSNLKVTLNFPYLTKNGVPISETINLNSFNQDYPITLTNFKLVTNGKTKLPMIIKIGIGNNPVNITSQPVIKIDIKIKKPLPFKVAYGKFLINSMSEKILTVPLDVLNELPDLRFYDPRGLIQIKSNLGNKLKFHINYVKAFNKTSYVKAIFANGKDSITEYLNERRNSIDDTDTIINNLEPINRLNGQTDKLFGTENKYDSLQYKFSLESDFSDPVKMFITPNMYLKANIKIQVPMQLKDSFDYTGTIKDVGIALKDIEEGDLVLNITNGLPGKVKFFMRFPNPANPGTFINDTTYTIIIDAPQLDNEGIVVSAQPQAPITIALTKAQLENLKKATDMTYTLRMVAKDEKNGGLDKLMYFSNKDYFKVKLGVYLKANTSIDLINN